MALYFSAMLDDGPINFEEASVLSAIQQHMVELGVRCALLPGVVGTKHTAIVAADGQNWVVMLNGDVVEITPTTCINYKSLDPSGRVYTAPVESRLSLNDPDLLSKVVVSLYGEEAKAATNERRRRDWGQAAQVPV